MVKSIYKIDRRRFLRISAVASAGMGLSMASYGFSNTIRFGVVTDSHYADRDPGNTRFYRESLAKMDECVQVMNQENVDFVVHLGDFKDEDPRKREKDTLRYLLDQEMAFSKFKGARYHCIGNHDVDSITKSQFLENITNTNIPESESFYSFDHQNFHFVVLDANFHEDGRDHFFKEGADWQNTNIPASQIDWLKNDLKAAEFPTIIFCHHPLYKYDFPPAKMHVSNFAELQKVFVDSGKVVAVFQGHVHEENYRKINGIHYITQYAMVDYSGLENNSFSIVAISNQDINITGYKRVLNRHFT